MALWLFPPDIQIPDDFQTALGGHPLVARILFRRGITGVEQALGFLDPTRYRPTPPQELPGMEKALDRLEKAILQKEPVWVWGDFDVDGQTATSILVSTLKELGAAVKYHIPIRADESHGVNITNLAPILDSGVKLILTCDTGISSHAAIDYAQSRGAQVIISDHHELPDLLPSAFVIVNPRFLAPGHPLASLSGSGVAYKLAEALFHRLGRGGDETRFLDLAALGIIADLADLKGDTRYLAQLGIAALRSTQRKGLLALFALNETNPQHITETHVSFIIAPRLNAQGRLDDANEMVEFLTTDDAGRAHILATRLEGLNAQRKLLTRQVAQAALAQIDKNPALLDSHALILSHPAWPGGVIGIVASQLASRFHRPVILITTPPGELARGSARSVEGCDITRALSHCAPLLSGFGGHPMAAGFAISTDNIPELIRSLNHALVIQQGPILQPKQIQIDAWQPLNQIDLPAVLELERLAPFGPGNPPVILAERNLTLVHHAPIGRDGDHLQMSVQNAEGVSQRVIWWQGKLFPLPEGKFDLAYTARASTYRGALDIQIEWIDNQVVEAPEGLTAPPRMTLHDFRRTPHPRPQLNALILQYPDLQIWAEGEARQVLNAKDREEISPTLDLAIWTSPPGYLEYQVLLDRIQPENLYLFAISPETDQPELFLKKLAGFVKYALLHQNGLVNVSRLAAATAQREASVRKGLAWLEARGSIHSVTLENHESPDLIQLYPGGTNNPRLEALALKQLQNLLDETRAFREYFKTADLQVISAIG